MNWLGKKEKEKLPQKKKNQKVLPPIDGEDLMAASPNIERAKGYFALQKPPPPGQMLLEIRPLG